MQATTEYNYLKFTSLDKTVFWDFYTLSNKNAITSDFTITKLSEVINQRKEFISINDNHLFKRCRVQIQGKGIVLRDEVVGKEIKTKRQQLCKTDDFLVAEIDAKVGGFGIVPQELENAIVSSHYFLFEINKKLLMPEFLSIVVKQEGFLKQVKSTGSTNYAAIRPHHVLDYKIPLPLIKEQEVLVNAYALKINQAKLLEQEAIDLEDEIEKCLYRELEVEMNVSSEKSSLLQFVPFEDTNRWDTLFLLGKVPTLKASYPIVDFSEAINVFNKDSNYNSIRIDSSNFPNEDFRYIGMEHIEKETGRLLDMPLVKGKEIKSQTIRVPKGFIIYGKLRPYLNKYWINETHYDNIICSSEFFVFDIHAKINKMFYKYILSSKIVQDQIADKTSGARMPRINEDVFSNLKFPLPPIEIQNEIALNIFNLKNRIEKAKLDSMKFRNEAEYEFENAIFHN